MQQLEHLDMSYSKISTYRMQDLLQKVSKDHYGITKLKSLILAGTNLISETPEQM